MATYIFSNRFRIVLLFCLPGFFGAAQTTDPSQEILPPSPTAASFSKYVDFPVNTSTGIPSVSVPIGSIGDNGISVPVSLEYHAGGVKVDEVAGIIGLGWTLNAGGMISRSVMGIPDEEADGYMNRGDEIPASPITTQAQFDAMQNFALGDWDGQPDLFNFSFGGYAGKFIFESPTTIRLIPKQDLKITYTTCSTCPGGTFGGSIISFTITTPDGIQYLFGTDPAVEYSTSSNYNVSGGSCIAKSYSSPAITGWHLKTITNPRTSAVVTFNYSTHQISYDISYNESFRYNRTGYPGGCPIVSSTAKCVTKKIDHGKHLASIVSNEGKIEFTSVTTRSDITVTSGQYRINEIKILGKDNSLQKYFQLTQTFVQSSGTTPSTATTSTYRMYLDDVKEYSASSTLINTQLFEYYSRTSFPPRLSYKQDHWGYYNNKSNTQLSPGPGSETELLSIQSKFPSFSPANRNPDATVAYYGTLKKVTYPTGGSTEYEFEGNEIAVCQTVDVPTDALAATSLTFAGTPQTSTVTFYVDHDQWVNINYNVLMNGFRCSGASARVKTTDSGNPFVTMTWGGCAQMISPIQLVGSVNKYMKTGNYELEVKVFQGPESGYPPPFSTQPEEAGITVKYEDNVPTYIANKAIGGIRLKKLTSADGATATAPDIVKVFQYQKANNGGCSNASSGVYLGRSPRYTSSDYQAVDNVIQCSYDVCQYSNITSSSLFNLTNNAGAIVAYAEVWALEGLNGENGKKYYLHEIFQDGNGLSGTNYYDIFLNAPTIDYSWKSGRVKEEKVFSSTGQVISHDLFEYEFNETNNKQTLNAFIARKAISPPCSGSFIYYCDGENDEGEEYLHVCNFWGNDCYYHYFPCYNQPAGTQITQTNQMEPYAVEWYSVVSQFVYLKKKTARQYNSDGSGNYIETITDYKYDTPAFRHLMPVKTITTNSDSYEYATISKYAPEYTTTTVADIPSVAIKALNDNFMINQPIETVQTIKKSGVESVTGAQAIKFKNFGGTRILSNEFWRVATTSPVALGSFSLSTITGGNFILDSRYYHVSTQGAYDSKANLLEWNKKDDQISAFIYGHGLSLPIAYVKNALSTEIAFTSFEEAGAGAGLNGNWAISGSAPTDWVNSAGFFVTGRTGFKIAASRTLTVGSLPAGKYVASFWYRDGQIKVNNISIGAVAGATWLYAETTLTLAANGVVTVTGSASTTYIDELRLYPADALMRTFSFDDRNQLLGSISDENSVAGHYEYDNSQRLQVIRDQDRNIQQTYEYNYQQAGPALNDIKARTALITGQTTVAQVNALTGADVRRVFQYMDGLGRPIQTNEIAQSPTNLDIVAYQPYDAFGRELKKYIPYTITSNGGTYRTGFAAEQLSFANTFGAGGYGYSETKVEPSPFNRPIEQAAPGDTWRIGNTRTLEYAYRGNTTSDAVHDFYSGSPFLGSNTYAANKLWVTQETDENERKKWTFTDKLGRVVLVKQELNATETAQTYTVYDDFGRVICVLPPETTKRMISSPNNWDINHASYASMIFKYAYDSRGRMTSKTVPSGGTTSIAYDRLDRPVLSTDAKSFKTFTRYDILSRPIVSGKYKGAGSPGVSDPLFETSNTTAPHYYTSTSFPTDNNLDVYKVFYYDDYDLDNNGSLGATETYTNPAESGYDATAFLRTRGKPTASKVGILLSSGLAPTNFLTTRTYYDKEYSVIQVNKQNHLGGADISSSAYDFANRVTKTRRDHTATPPGGSLKTYYIREEFTYDAASRLRFTRHHISTTAGVPTAGWVVPSAPLYDEMGRLLDKRLHASNYDGSSGVTLNSSFTYLQSLDYTYNIRGWLTGINDPTICTAQSGDDAIDLFRMSLEYESTANGGTAQYNGNISTIQWNTNINGTCSTRNLYRFSYDYTNRLTGAAYRARVGTSWVDQSKYSEGSITYDLNGNLKTYLRRGHTTGSLIDNLTYTYGDAARPDRLTNMVDAADATKGFKYTAGAADYQYDLNGNLTQDNHKGFTFGYNYLNLPQSMTKGADVITMTYTADGEKLTKALTGGGATKSYVSGIEYSGTNLEAIYFSEGRCTPNGSSAFYYEYSVKDHLGNARVSFRANGTSLTPLQENHYYPFGLEMEGSWIAQVGTENQYQYNGKELNEDFGLNLCDYGARWYDAALGRWWSVDPMGEKMPFYSTYSYVINNPMALIDPDGMQWVNPYYGQIDQELGKAEVNLKRIEELAALGNKVQGLINEIKEKDPELYDYVENLSYTSEVPDENGGDFVSKSQPIEVRVYLTDAQKGEDGQRGETLYDPKDNTIDYNGLSINTPLSKTNSNVKLAGGLKFKVNRPGFNILLYNNFNSVTTSTLANEAGDVMAYMEYSKVLIKDFDDSDKGYNDRFATKYSNAVENAHNMIANGKLPKQGIFPFKTTGKSFIAQNGTKIKH
jgi:RHS repeat-associated protein